MTLRSHEPMRPDDKKMPLQDIKVPAAEKKQVPDNKPGIFIRPIVRPGNDGKKQEEKKPYRPR